MLVYQLVNSLTPQQTPAPGSEVVGLSLRLTVQAAGDWAF